MNNMLPKVVFCPNCHKPVRVPKIAGQINVASGFITLECQCKNKIKLKTEKKGSAEITTIEGDFIM